MTEITASAPVIFRPRRVRRVASVLAVALVLVFSVIGALLRIQDTGVRFQTSDQIAMVLLGMILAGGVLLFTRPALIVTDDLIRVRTPVTEHRYRWDEIVGFSFPEGAAWARLVLPDDEYTAILAIQANDKLYAVEQMRQLREIAAKHSERQAPTG